MLYLLLLALFITNILPLFLLSASNNLLIYKYILDPAYVNSAAGFVSVFVTSLLIGHSFPQGSRPRASRLLSDYEVCLERKIAFFGASLFFYLSLACSAGFVLSAGDSFWGASLYREGVRYGQKYDHNIAGNFSFLFMVFFALYVYSVLAKASLRCIAQSETPPSQTKMLHCISKKDLLCLLFLFAYSTLYLVGGDRGGFLMIALLVFSSYTIITPTLNRQKISLAIIFGIFFMAFVGAYRSTESASLLGFWAAVSDESFLFLIRELYGSIVHIQAASYLSDKDGLHYGGLWFSPVLSVVPLFIRGLSEIGAAPLHMESATYFTDYILKGDVHTGLGTNLVADVYINFGLFGLVFFGYMLGYFYRYLLNGIDGVRDDYNVAHVFIKNRYRVITFLILTSGFLYLPRASLFHEFKAICWALLVFYVFRVLVRGKLRI